MNPKLFKTFLKLKKTYVFKGQIKMINGFENKSPVLSRLKTYWTDVL